MAMPPTIAVRTGYLTEPLSQYAGVCLCQYIESRSIISNRIGNVGSQATPLDLGDDTIREMVIDSLSCPTRRDHLLGLRNADARKAMHHILKVFLQRTVLSLR